MNAVSDPEELRLLCEEETEQRKQVKLLWQSNAAVPPLEAFKDDAQPEGDGDNLLP